MRITGKMRRDGGSASMFPSCCSKAAESAGKRSSVAKLLLGVFVVYMLHSAWMLYSFLNTKPCDGGRGELCITSYLAARPRLQLSVFTCLVPDNSPLSLALTVDPFDPYSTFERRVNISLPDETRVNGSLYAVVYVHKVGVSPLEDRREVHYAAHLTTHVTPPHAEGPEKPQQKRRSESPVSHWRPHLSVTMMSEDFSFSKAGLPSDVRRYIRASQEGRQMMYLPLLLVNELSVRVRDLMEIRSSTAQLPLTLSYEGISLRRFRFWIHLHDIVYSLRQFGFTEENIDEIKETLMGSNLYLLVLTAIITALQLLFLVDQHSGYWRVFVRLSVHGPSALHQPQAEICESPAGVSADVQRSEHADFRSVLLRLLFRLLSALLLLSSTLLLQRRALLLLLPLPAKTLCPRTEKTRGCCQESEDPVRRRTDEEHGSESTRTAGVGRIDPTRRLTVRAAGSGRLI
ncbi:cleft lip and palate transmembrane protein 1-like protein isoform X3 [Kryptolebias marmoratus]|uniref:cleft lip and palate transmembrane protein 1-like protein isoform X3 n=1 Tax=Kryptolebias marmoratus TaxID=37003 RepID=UPI0007F8845B|nr:cleft lip and palate transmembrane protein 1-like protein isoform X3 [Kryptolebias marmoratus]